MKLQDLTLAELKEIVDGAPEGAEYYDPSINGYLRCAGFDAIKLSDIRAELKARPKFKVGDLVVLNTGRKINRVDHIYRTVVWLDSGKESCDVVDIRDVLRHATPEEEAAGHRIDEPKQKYDWSNVPDVVNWLATDKDGDCAWGFLEEPVIELEDGEWRPVAPYTEIYINGSNGTVAAYKGDWQESLEQRKFKIGDKVTFIRNIEPFQWGAKEKVYEVVDVADNLPTSTDQRVWLDTTASSPHLSRNLCLATAIGQVGIEDLPIHGEPISSEIITNAPVIDELEAQKNISVTLSAEIIESKGVEQSDTITAKLDPAKCRTVDPALAYDEPYVNPSLSDEPWQNVGPKTQLDNEAALFNELPIDAELEVPVTASQHPHYFKDVSGLTHIDVYQVLRLYEVTDPCLQHIVKKALCAGKRGSKDFVKDVQEIADTANRLVEIEGEQGE